MSTPNFIEIHETAFVTSAYRATYEDVSKDTYARLWNNSKTTEWIKHFTQLVSKDEALTHCLRNRYFYEKISRAVKRNEIEVLINFGCGFSMYPFLLPEQLVHIEIDKPDIIAHKREKVNRLVDDYKLPKREIHYLSSDFSKDYEVKLLNEIRSVSKEKSTFILVEGVLFFLNEKETLRLFDFFAKIQGPNDLIGSVSYSEAVEKTAVFKRLMNFFKHEVASDEIFDYQIVPESFYKSLDHYEVIDQQDYYTLIDQFTSERAFNDEVLNENMYLLKKKS